MAARRRQLRLTRKTTWIILSDERFKTYVVVPYELPIEERNYFLLLFSKGEKRRRFIEELLARGEVELLQYAYDLYPNEVKEVVRMARADDVIDLDGNARVIVKDIGPKRILEVITPEEIAAYLATEKLAAVPPEQRLAGISEEQRLAGISEEQRLAGISEEQRLAGISREALQEQIAKLDDGGQSRKKPRRSKARKTIGSAH